MKVKNKVKDFRMMKRRRMQWIISGSLSIVLFMITYLTTDVLFSTNDDIRIMYALAGYNTGEPYACHPFINFFLGKLISVQYQLFPEIPWYAVFHCTCLFVGTMVIGKCLYKIAEKKKCPVYIPIIFQIVLFYTILIFPVVSMQFSTTPAVLGIAAAALVYSLDITNDEKKYIYGDLVISILFLFVCYMTRSFTWYCVMCFYGLAIFYQLIHFFPKFTKEGKNWIFVFGGCIVITVIGVFGLRTSSLYIKAKMELNKEFEVYNEYRTEFQDYKKRPNYEENISFYQNIGWTENTYRAVLGLVFLDENINADSMQKITEEYENSSKGRTLTDAYSTAISIFQENRVAKTGIAVIIFLFVSILIISIRNRQLWRELLCSSLGFFGYCVMFFYLSYRGRLPIRTFMVITISEAVLLFTFLMSVLRIPTRKKTYLFFSSICIGLFLLVVYNIRAIYLTDECTKTQTKTSATVEQVIDFEQYALEHQEDVFIYDFTVATVQREPFVVYPNQRPTNCIISGGSYTFSSIYYQQLKTNHMDLLYWENLLEDNIFYVSADISFVELVQKNIEEKTGKEIKYKEIEAFGNSGVKIYKFVD